MMMAKSKSECQDRLRLTFHRLAQAMGSVPADRQGCQDCRCASLPQFPPCAFALDMKGGREEMSGAKMRVVLRYIHA